MREDPVTTDEQPADGGAGPAIRRRGVDPRRVTRWLWRGVPLLMIGAALVFSWCFGVVRVPAGMDALPAISADSVCLIDKREGSVMVGSAVFVDLPEGGTVLSRVAELLPGDKMRLQNDDAESVQPDSEELGLVPLECLRGVVLVVFAGKGPPGELIRGS